MNNNSSFLIWDSKGKPHSGFQKFFLWKSFEFEKYQDAISIPKVIEENSKELKNQYLNIVYKLGNKKLNGKSIISHMQIRKEFNYWWMTLINEKCNYTKSPLINDAIRLLAFNKIIRNETISKIVFVSSNNLLAECLEILCSRKQIEFEWQYISPIKKSNSIIKKIYHSFPLIFKAIFSLILYTIQRWPLRGIGLNNWQSTEAEVSFFSYFFNLDPKSAKLGNYKSQFWGNLPEELLKDDISTNWCHIFVKDRFISTPKKAAALIKQFNKISNAKQNHITIDTFLGWKIIVKTFLDWFRLLKRAKKIKRLSSIKKERYDYLLPLFKNDLDESIYGPTALSNLLYFNLFEKAISLLPKQKRGIYLQENQGWEFALIQIWKQNQKNQIIGVPHSSVRFWDLRYFFDKNCYNKEKSKDENLPLPDKVAVIGKLMHKMYIEGGYRKSDLINVEALRYLYLNKININNSLVNGKKTLLVLGEYLFDNTDHQIRILESAFASLSNNIKILVKPHPNCPIDPSKYPGIKMNLTNDSMANLLPQCNIAYTSNVTSAALDAYCANIPVISVLNPETLNMSPLIGINGIKFIRNSEELINSIYQLSANPTIKRDNIFWLNSDLPMWKNIINNKNN